MKKFLALFALIVLTLAACAGPQVPSTVPPPLTPLKTRVQVEISSEQDSNFRYVLSLTEGLGNQKVLIFTPTGVSEVKIITAYFPGTSTANFCQSVAVSRYGGDQKTFLRSMPWRGFLLKPYRLDGAGHFLPELYAANLEVKFGCGTREAQTILVDFWYGPKERFAAAAREAKAVTIEEFLK